MAPGKPHGERAPLLTSSVVWKWLKAAMLQKIIAVVEWNSSLPNGYMLNVNVNGWWRGSAVWLADFTWSTPNLWLTGDHFVGSIRYGSTNQANSAFYPFGVGKWVLVTLHGLWQWRLLNGRHGLCVAVWPQGQSSVCARLSLRPIGCMLALSVTQNAGAAAVYGLLHYISDGPLHFTV